MEKGNNLMSPIRKESVVQQIINKITDAIISGELKPGDRCPPKWKWFQLIVGQKHGARLYVPWRLIAWLRYAAPREPSCATASQIRSSTRCWVALFFRRKDSYKDLIGLRQMIETGVLRMLQEGG